jgi:predicted ArsR family transcriptional regulator
MTDNAVRSHLTALERDALIASAGLRRSPGAGKPAVRYELAASAEVLLSRAYPPVLNAVLETLVQEVPDRVDEVLRRTGELLAQLTGGRSKGPFRKRVQAAADVLKSLGGDVEVLEERGDLLIQGCGCPLSAAVAERPEVCQAVEALVGSVAGAAAVSHCVHGPRPRCRFRFTEGPANSSAA